MACHSGPDIGADDKLVSNLDARNFKSYSQTDTPNTPTTWTAEAAAEDNGWRDVAYGNDKFVAVAKDGTNRIMYSTDGDTWTSATTPLLFPQNYWRAIAYGGGYFVAISSNGIPRACYSADGSKDWETSSGGVATWRDMCYSDRDGKFVAVASNVSNAAVQYTSIYDEEPLEDWTSAPPAEFNSWRGICYGNGKYVAVSSNGTNRVMYSTDADNWTSASAAENNSWQSIIYAKGKYVAVSSSGTNRVMYSTDGINWSNSGISGVEESSWRSITYGGGKFVAVAAGGTNRIMYSTDGISWTATSATEDNSWLSVAYGNGYFAAVAQNGTNRVMTYQDATIWTDTTRRGNTATLNRATYKSDRGGCFIFDGTNDEITLGATTDIQSQNGDWTWESWFRVDSAASSYNYLFAYGPPHQIAWYDNQLNAWFNDTDSTSSYDVSMASGSNTVPTGQWTHGAVSRIGSSWKLYINGEEKASATANFTVANSSTGPRIGSYDGSQYFFDGKIANMRIYKGKGLTAREVNRNFNAHKRKFS